LGSHPVTYYVTALWQELCLALRSDEVLHPS
jgi:hypothetical protein